MIGSAVEAAMDEKKGCSKKTALFYDFKTPPDAWEFKKMEMSGALGEFSKFLGKLSEALGKSPEPPGKSPESFGKISGLFGQFQLSINGK